MHCQCALFCCSLFTVLLFAAADDDDDDVAVVVVAVHFPPEIPNHTHIHIRLLLLHFRLDFNNRANGLEYIHIQPNLCRM